MPRDWMDDEHFTKKSGVIAQNIRENKKLQQELGAIEASRHKRIEELDSDILTYQTLLRKINARLTFKSSASKYEVESNMPHGAISQEDPAHKIANIMEEEQSVPRLEYKGSSKGEPPEDKGLPKRAPILLRRRRAFSYDSHGVTSRDRTLSNELQEKPHRSKSHSFTEPSQNIKWRQDISGTFNHSPDDSSILGINGKPLSMHSEGGARRRRDTPHPKVEELVPLNHQHPKGDDRAGNFAGISQRRFDISGHVTQPRKDSGEVTQKMCSFDVRAASRSRQQLTRENTALFGEGMGLDSKGLPCLRKHSIENWIQREKERENSEEKIKQLKSLDLPFIGEKSKLGRSKSLSPRVQGDPKKEGEGLIGNSLRKQLENIFVTAIEDENEEGATGRVFEKQASQNETWEDQRQRAKSLPVAESSVTLDFLRGLKSREKRYLSDSSDYYKI